ncbi:hypothetical protein [Algoriphagus sediminis]|uniref:SH3 domain-containing protein n=1 Tax=Algoriphagus sediminis TaxID=3057113 RepID=A0ABT7Y8U2_9BACT|nr:hypothetical protein [Algoriphagus sediminis]MDN3202886.1 hypothetical protein [Algoriphagus sediminis]
MPREKFKEWPLIDAFGICRLSILPVYSAPTFDSFLFAQLLFGECYQVTALTPDRKWFKIHQEDSEISGWITSDSLKEITKDDYERFNGADYQVVNSPIAAIEYQGTNLYLLPGSRLHFSEIELFNWKDHVGFTGSVRSHRQRATREELIEVALKFLNTPFQSGGRSIFGMDHRWFFPLVFSISGYKLRMSKHMGELIEEEEVMPGDFLSLLDTSSNPLGLALYLGAEQVLWMDNKVKVTDTFDWERQATNNYAEEAVCETRSILE